MCWVKVKHLMLCLTFVVAMTSGCNNSSDNKEGYVVEEKSGIIDNETSVFASDSGETTSNIDAYSVEACTIEEEGKNITYPIIKGLDNNVQKKWNNIIKSKIDNAVKKINEDNEYTLYYKVMTQTEDMLSILFAGTTGIVDADDEYKFMYTYNINMKTGENVRLCDYDEIGTISEKLYDGTDILVLDGSQAEFMDYISDFFVDKNEIYDTLNNFDYVSEETFPTGYSYYEDGKVILCMEVNHLLGDYVRISVN